MDNAWHLGHLNLSNRLPQCSGSIGITVIQRCGTALRAQHYPPEMCSKRLGGGGDTSAPGGSGVICQQRLPGNIAAGMSAISQPDRGNLSKLSLLLYGRKASGLRVWRRGGPECGGRMNTRDKLHHIWEFYRGDVGYLRK